MAWTSVRYLTSCSLRESAAMRRAYPLFRGGRFLLRQARKRGVVVVHVRRRAHRLVLLLRRAVLRGRRVLRDVRVVGRDRGLAHVGCLPTLARRRTASGARTTDTITRRLCTATMKVMFPPPLKA